MALNTIEKLLKVLTFATALYKLTQTIIIRRCYTLPVETNPSIRKVKLVKKLVKK
jgi:hypothetical protein